MEFTLLTSLSALVKGSKRAGLVRGLAVVVSLIRFGFLARARFLWIRRSRLFSLKFIGLFVVETVVAVVVVVVEAGVGGGLNLKFS